MKIVNIPVEMIAWFTAVGVIQPVRFRVKDQQQPNMVLKLIE